MPFNRVNQYNVSKLELLWKEKLDKLKKMLDRGLLTHWDFVNGASIVKHILQLLSEAIFQLINCKGNNITLALARNEESTTGSAINLWGYLTVRTAALKSWGKSFINRSLKNGMESHLRQTIFTPLSPDCRPSGEKKPHKSNSGAFIPRVDS